MPAMQFLGHFLFHHHVSKITFINCRSGEKRRLQLYTGSDEES